MAELIPWHERYSVGNPEIDEQHKHLVKLINVLQAAGMQGKDVEYIEKIYGELVNYTSYHFIAEEKLYAETFFPELEKHKAEHDEFKQWLIGAKAKLTDPKKKKEFSSEALNYLKSWLTSHILTSDKKNAYYLRKTTGTVSK